MFLILARIFCHPIIKRQLELAESLTILMILFSIKVDVFFIDGGGGGEGSEFHSPVFMLDSFMAPIPVWILLTYLLGV